MLTIFNQHFWLWCGQLINVANWEFVCSFVITFPYIFISTLLSIFEPDIPIKCHLSCFTFHLYSQSYFIFTRCKNNFHLANFSLPFLFSLARTNLPKLLRVMHNECFEFLMNFFLNTFAIFLHFFLSLKSKLRIFVIMKEIILRNE